MVQKFMVIHAKPEPASLRSSSLASIHRPRNRPKRTLKQPSVQLLDPDAVQVLQRFFGGWGRNKTVEERSGTLGLVPARLEQDWGAGRP